MPLISIIVPVYNVENYLKRCIESILNQTFWDFELILVNDGSTDKSGNICDEYSMIDNRVKIIHKENGGLSSARNTGIKLAKGKYIGFVDSDDYINNMMYEILYKFIEMNDADIAICNYKKVSDDSILNKEVNWSKIGVEKFSNIEALEQIYEMNGPQFVTAWNKLYKKELFINCKYPEGKINEDEFIAHKLLYNSDLIIYVNEKLYYYYLRENSIMNSKFTIKRFDAVYAYKDRVNFFREINQKRLQYKAEYFFIEYFFRYYYRAKRELNMNKVEMLRIKRIFDEEVLNLLMNPSYNLKEKCMWILFYINPKLYEYKIKGKNRR